MIIKNVLIADESTFITWFAIFIAISTEIATAMASAWIIIQITTLMIISKWEFKHQRMKKCHKQRWKQVVNIFMAYLKSWLKYIHNTFLKRPKSNKKKISRYKPGTPSTYLKKSRGRGHTRLSTTFCAYKKAACPWIKRFYPLNIWALEVQGTSRQSKAVYTEFDTDSYQIRIDSHCSYCITNNHKDFIGTPKQVYVSIKGVGGSQTSSLKGTVRWSWLNDLGQPITFDIPGTYYIPRGPGRILSPQHWAQVLRKNGDPSAHTIGTWNNIKLIHQQGTNTTTVKLSRSGNVPILMSLPGYHRAAEHSRQKSNKTRPVAFPTYITDDEESDDDECEQKDSPRDNIESNIKQGHNHIPSSPATKEQDSRPVTVTFDISTDSPLHTAREDENSAEWENFTPQALFLHWHYRLNHPPMDHIIALAKQGKLPKKLLKARPPRCPACMSGKATKRPWRTRAPPNALSVPSITSPGDCIAVDQLESTTPGLLAQLKGFLTKRRLHHATVFVDMYSHAGFIYCQETNNGPETIMAKEAFELWSRNRGVRIRHYHADNGRFAEQMWMEHCRTHGQTYSFCGVNAHHQNGVAERRIRELQERARTSLIHAARRWPDAINAHLWPYAIRTACETFNHTPSQGESSPIEKFSQIPVDVRLRNFHHFGCPAYVLDSDLQSGKRMTRHKWGDRSRVGINLGPSPNHAPSVSLILNLQTGFVSPQFHVKFDDHFETAREESSIDIPKSQWQVKCFFRRVATRTRATVSRSQPTSLTTASGTTTAPRQGTGGSTGHAHPRTEVNPLQDEGPIIPFEAAPDQPTTASEGVPTSPNRNSTSSMLGAARGASVTRYGRQIRPTRGVSGFVATINYDGTNELTFQNQHPLAAYAASADPDILYLHEAMAAPDREKWLESMDSELRDHENRGHWKLMQRDEIPKGATLLPMVWAMRRKRKIKTNEVYKWKSRLNVGGHRQKQGENYWDTDSPTLSWPTIRFFLIISLIRGWTTRQLDFIQAYPQADAECEMFMHLPPGYNFKGSRKTHVLKLIRNIYGAKQAGRVWYNHLHDNLIKLGFVRSNIDKCIFYKGTCVLLVYVDDCIIMGPHQSEIDEIISDMSGELRMEDQGDLEDYLGVNISRGKDNTFTLAQPQLIQSILEDLNLTGDNVKVATTPALSTRILHADLEGEPFDEHFNYRRVIGKLNYLERSTRPDLAFAVHQCARFSANPKQSHAKAVKRIGRYLAATKDKGYTIRPEGEEFEVFADASFSGEWDNKRIDQAVTDPNMARSRTGYGIFYGKCLILAQSRLQTEIALSSTEAEFIALSSAAREVIHLMSIMEEASTMGVPIRNTAATVKCTIFEDNSGAAEIAKIPKIRPRTKHINIKYWHFIKWVETNQIIIKQVRTTEQLADIWTKPLDEKLFIYFRDLIMNWNHQSKTCEGVLD